MISACGKGGQREKDALELFDELKQQGLSRSQHRHVQRDDIGVRDCCARLRVATTRKDHSSSWKGWPLEAIVDYILDSRRP